VCVALLQIRVTGGATKHRQATLCAGDTVFPTLCPTASFMLMRKSISATYTTYYQKSTTSIEQNALMAVNRHQYTQPPTPTPYHHMVPKTSPPYSQEFIAGSYSETIQSQQRRIIVFLQNKFNIILKGLHDCKRSRPTPFRFSGQFYRYF
jgi:hypothetical protein